MKKRHSFLARAAMMLLLAVFTTMTAWATNATPLTSTEGLKLVPGLSATGSSNWVKKATAVRDVNRAIPLPYFISVLGQNTREETILASG